MNYGKKALKIRPPRYHRVWLESFRKMDHSGIAEGLTHGFVRTISRSLADCELLHLPREKFDVQLAAEQHTNYVTALQDAGLTVTVLPEEPELPDACFVEDTAIILNEVAVLCRLGVSSRSGEPARMEHHLSRFRPLERICAPGTIEGGDVLRIEKTLYVGSSTRTNVEGIQQLTRIGSRHGYKVVSVSVSGCLHLKTAVTSPRKDLLLVNPNWVEVGHFRGFEILTVPAAEPWGANTLPISDLVLVLKSCPRTVDLLFSKGLDVRQIDISELQKAEAGLTCLSLLLRHERMIV